MTAIDERCDICRSPDYVGVASIPGFPVSVAWCQHCLARCAYPLFCAEATLCDEGLSLPETIAKHGLSVVRAGVADWFLDQWFWIEPSAGRSLVEMEREGIVQGPGHYVLLEDLLDKWTDW